MIIWEIFYIVYVFFIFVFSKLESVEEKKIKLIYYLVMIY